MITKFNADMFVGFNTLNKVYTVEIGIPDKEYHVGMAETPPRAAVLAAMHWVNYVEPGLASQIDFIEEMTARGESLGIGLVAYPIENIRALLTLIRGETVNPPRSPATEPVPRD